jgi:hypothetical protein
MSLVAFAKESIRAKQLQVELIQLARLVRTVPLDLLDEQFLGPESPGLSETDLDTPLTTGTPVAAARIAAAVDILNVLNGTLPLPATVIAPGGRATQERNASS